MKFTAVFILCHKTLVLLSSKILVFLFLILMSPSDKLKLKAEKMTLNGPHSSLPLHKFLRQWMKLYLKSPPLPPPKKEF